MTTPTDPDLRTVVARAIWNAREDRLIEVGTYINDAARIPFGELNGLAQSDILHDAAAAIAAAEPIIRADERRKVIAELAAKADMEDLAIVRRINIPGTYLVEEGGDVAAWLRAQEADPGE